jgi:hypothetical protein
VSRALDAAVPAVVRDLLVDEPERRIGVTVLVLTVGEQSLPHVAMVSVGELALVAERRLALALWPASTCAANLDRERRATLAVVLDGHAYSLHCRVVAGHELGGGTDPPLLGFELEVTSAFDDVAPYADLLCGVSFRLHDETATVGRWRRTRSALRESFAAPDR